MAESATSKVSEAPRTAVGRDGVLDIAARLFREQGYGTVSLRKIAEAAGIKAGSIYYHFGSKDEIVAAVLDVGIHVVHENMRQAVSALPKDTGAETILRAAIGAHLRALLDLSDYTSPMCAFSDRFRNPSGMPTCPRAAPMRPNGTLCCPGFRTKAR